MITAKAALQTLQDKCFIDSWEMKTNRQNTLKWKSPVVKSENVSVSDETYGSKSFLYFRCKSEEVAKEIAQALQNVGGKPSFEWCPDDPKCFDMQVSKFHGWHHWE